MGAELSKTDKQSSAVGNELFEFIVIFINHRIPAEVEQQTVLFEILSRSLGRNFIEVAVGSS